MPRSPYPSWRFVLRAGLARKPDCSSQPGASAPPTRPTTRVHRAARYTLSTRAPWRAPSAHPSASRTRRIPDCTRRRQRSTAQPTSAPATRNPARTPAPAGWPCPPRVARSPDHRSRHRRGPSAGCFPASRRRARHPPDGSTAARMPRRSATERPARSPTADLARPSGPTRPPSCHRWPAPSRRRSLSGPTPSRRPGARGRRVPSRRARVQPIAAPARSAPHIAPRAAPHRALLGAPPSSRDALPCGRRSRRTLLRTFHGQGNGQRGSGRRGPSSSVRAWQGWVGLARRSRGLVLQD